MGSAVYFFSNSSVFREVENYKKDANNRFIRFPLAKTICWRGSLGLPLALWSGCFIYRQIEQPLPYFQGACAQVHRGEADFVALDDRGFVHGLTDGRV